MIRRSTLCFAILWCNLLPSLVGCNQSLDTSYGSSRGYSAKQSINGFAALREAYKLGGWKTRDVNRLSSRLTSVDAIVWTPTERDTLYDNAQDWFEDWFTQGTRTLVYVVPDDGCEEVYFDWARREAPASQKLEYRRRMASIETTKMLKGFDAGAIAGNRWFTLERLPARTGMKREDGRWAQRRGTSAGADPSSIKMPPIPLTYRVLPGTTITNQSGPSAIAPAPVDGYEYDTLIPAEDSTPAVVEITNQAWGESKIVVVGSGSLLSNFSLATPDGQWLAANLIDETADEPGLIGFMTTSWGGANVSDVDPELNSVSGIELLTVWPLSLIMLHLLVLGFVSCMILLPIFGRPREPQLASTSDFADHLDAVATLMSRSGGEDYARRRVSDYLKRVRGETVGPWILPEVKPEKPSTANVATRTSSDSRGQSSLGVQPEASSSAESRTPAGEPSPDATAMLPQEKSTPNESSLDQPIVPSPKESP